MTKHTVSTTLCFVVLSVSCAVQANPQYRTFRTSSTVTPSTARIATLSVADKRHVLNDKFTVVNKVLDIPGPVLGRLLGSKPFDGMADPGQPYQESDVVLDDRLPSRRLIFAAISKSYCLVYYEHGGFVYDTEVALYRLEYPKVTLTWHSSIGGPTLCKDLESLRSEIKKVSTSKLGTTEL